MSVKVSEPTPFDPALLSDKTKRRGELRLSAEKLEPGMSITLTGKGARAQAARLAAIMNGQFRAQHGKRLPRPYTSRFLGLNEAGEEQALLIRIEGN